MHIVLTANEHEKRAGYHDRATQVMANDLPQWHTGRRLRTSNYHQVLNVVAGKPVGLAEISMDKDFLDSLLSVVETDHPDTLLKYQVPANIGLYETFASKNLALNGSFRVRTNPIYVADLWDSTGDVVRVSPGYTSSVCPVIRRVLDTGGSLTQSQYMELTPGTQLCFPLYYMIPTWNTAGASKNDAHSILIRAHYKDATTEVFRSRLELHTSGIWTRLYATASLSKPVYMIDISVTSYTSASMITTQPIYVDNAMLEFASRPSQWEPSRRDYPHYMDIEEPCAVTFDAEHPLFYADTMDDFWYKSIPTRTGIVHTQNSTIPVQNIVGRVLLTDFFGSDWDAGFSHTTNNIVKEGITCPGEVYGTYELAFYNNRGFYQTGYSYDILALAWFHDMLWALVNHTAVHGKLLLCVIDPRVPSPEPDYLEVIASVELDGIPLTADRLEFRYRDQQHIYIGDAATEYVVRLYYDYFMFNKDTYLSYFREQYDSLVLENDGRI